MAQVNCYLPDELKRAFEDECNVAFSEVLRRGVIAELHKARQAAEPASEPAEA